MAYLSTADLKVYLGIATGQTGDDTLLATLAGAAQAFVEQYTRRAFEHSGTAAIRYHDAVGDVDAAQGLLFLRGDLCAITSVTNGDGVVVTAAQYVTEPRSTAPYWALRLLPSSNVVWTFTTDEIGAIAISGKWAYSATPPADIVQATTRLAAYLYRQKDNSLDLDRAVALGGSGMLLPTALPADLKALLEPYRRVAPNG
jgi:hypothetical protein